MGKTSTTVKDRYNRKTYDAITIRLKAGGGAKVRAAAAAAGESLNAFVASAIEERMVRLGFSAESSEDECL